MIYFLAISAAAFPIIVNYVIKKRYKLKSQELQTKKDDLDKSYYHCIFWTSHNSNCREHVTRNIECGKRCSVTYLKTLLNLLSSAKTSISMCMYYLTLKQITDELLKAKNKGVNVRIITDSVTYKMRHSKVQFLRNKYGFEVRTPPHQGCFMHHKYCVIDNGDVELQKMFLGSLNLTLQGIVANFEFVVITNNSHIIHHYSNEFETLWTEFQDPEWNEDHRKTH